MGYKKGPKEWNATRMTLITVHLPPKVLERIETVIVPDIFNNRSEFIRHLVVKYLDEKEAKDNVRYLRGMSAPKDPEAD